MSVKDVRDETKRGANDERNVRQTAVTLRPSVIVLEGQGNDTQEQECDAPGKCDPAEQRVSRRKTGMSNVQ